MRVLALGGVAGPAVLVVVTVIAAAVRPDYSHVSQFISELGATGSPRAVLMNYLGFIPTGLLLLGFAASYRVLLPRARFTTTAAILLAFFALGIVVAGLASCDVGCPQDAGSLANTIHNTVSPLAFLAAIAAAAASGLFFRSDSVWRDLWAYSVGTAVLGAVLMAALVTSLQARTLTGLWQRLFLAVVLSWCATVGLRLSRLEAQLPQPSHHRCREGAL